MRNICVIGVGYVGLVTGTCFADLGNRVVALDISEKRIENLKHDIMPIYEPGLKEIVERNVKADRLTFTTSYKEALKDAEFAFICVGTPEGVDGEADLQYVRMAAESIAQSIDHYIIVINKSTVPVGTGDWVAGIIRESLPKPIPFAVVSCPEFLREGSAVRDFFNPDRTVLGSTDKEACNKVAQLHLPLRAPIVITDLRTAEMIKYASNAFLATKISFINELADLCELVGADVKEVAAGMGYDARIGRHFLDAGLGWGGSCFPKDVEALAYMAKEKGLNPRILNQVMDINYDRRKAVVGHLEQLLNGSLKGKTIGLLGLAFKPNTDDMRDAPSIDISNSLIAIGAKVRGYDPVARHTAAPWMPKVEIFDDVYKMAKDCDALVVVTEWNEFKQLDLEKLKGLLNCPVVYDGRKSMIPPQ
jgi:UDPglucose 6-dehydrogenase